MSELIYNEKDLTKLKNFRRDIEWFKANYESIKSEYKGQYVAIVDEEIIDNDDDVKSLLDRLEAKGIDLTTIVVEYINPYKVAYVL